MIQQNQIISTIAHIKPAHIKPAHIKPAHIKPFSRAFHEQKYKEFIQVILKF
jgi:hypothetical protein